jgi:hypothetical protein
MPLESDGETYIVPAIDKVRLLSINERGLLLTGYERIPPRRHKRDGLTYVQTWWRELPAVMELEGFEPSVTGGGRRVQRGLFDRECLRDRPSHDKASQAAQLWCLGCAFTSN